MNFSFRFVTFSLAFVLLFSSVLSADSIRWQSSTDLYPGSTNQSFVDNSTGTFVLGFSGTGEAATPNTDPGVNGTTVTTVNGVDFQNVNGFNLNAGVVTNGTTSVTASPVLRNDSNAYGDGSFNGDGDIFALIAGGVFDEGSITFTGLTIGNQYMVQIFINDARSGRNSDWNVGFSDGVNDFATSMANGTYGRANLSNRDPVSGMGEASGDSIVGLFVATSDTLSFDFVGTRDNFATVGPSAQVNGLQLRDLGTPSVDLITWQASTDMYQGSTTQDFVDNSTGTFVLGFSGTGEAATPDDDPSVDGSTVTSVNGVDFQNVNGFNLNAGVVTDGTATVTVSPAIRNDSNAYGDGSFTGDVDIFSLIGGGVFDQGTINFSGLTIGNQYMVQIFVNDARPDRNSDWSVGFSNGLDLFSTSLANGTFGSANLNNTDPDSGLGEPSGDSIIGTFTATTGVMRIQFRGTMDNFVSSGFPSQINGLQLRDLGTTTGEEILVADSLIITAGTLSSGGLPELGDSDNQDLSLRRSNSDIQSRTGFSVSATSTIQSPSAFEITVEASVFARTPVNQIIELFDYDLQAWEQVDVREASRFIDSTVTVQAAGDLSRFVEDGTGLIEARIRYQSVANPRQAFSSNTDLVTWTITP